jgi:hypothetical protein
MKQFDAPKKNNQQDDGWNKAIDALDALADDLESDGNENEANNEVSEPEENEDGEIEDGTFDG